MILIRILQKIFHLIGSLVLELIKADKTKLPKRCQYCQEAVEKWSSQKYFEPKTENYKNSTEKRKYYQGCFNFNM